MTCALSFDITILAVYDNIIFGEILFSFGVRLNIL